MDTKLQQFIAKHLGVDAGAIQSFTTFESFDMNNWDLLDLAVEVEKAFRIPIEAGDELKWRTVKDVEDYISRTK